MIITESMMSRFKDQGRAIRFASRAIKTLWVIESADHYIVSKPSICEYLVNTGRYRYC